MTLSKYLKRKAEDNKRKIFALRMMGLENHCSSCQHYYLSYGIGTCKGEGAYGTASPAFCDHFVPRLLYKESGK